MGISEKQWRSKKVPKYRTIYNILVTKSYYFTSKDGIKRIRCPQCNSSKETAITYFYLCIDCLKIKKLRKKYKGM